MWFFYVSIILLSGLINLLFNVAFCQFFYMEVNWKIILAMFIGCVLLNVIMTGLIILSLACLLIVCIFKFQYPWEVLLGKSFLI